MRLAGGDVWWCTEIIDSICQFMQKQLTQKAAQWMLLLPANAFAQLDKLRLESVVLSWFNNFLILNILIFINVSLMLFLQNMSIVLMKSWTCCATSKCTTAPVNHVGPLLLANYLLVIIYTVVLAIVCSRLATIVCGSRNCWATTASTFVISRIWSPCSVLASCPCPCSRSVNWCLIEG